MSELIFAEATVITCVGYALIKYNYVLPADNPRLNPIGNFYRASHYHKATQRKIDQIVENGTLPQKGDTIFVEVSGRQLSLYVTAVVKHHMPSEKAIELMRYREATVRCQWEVITIKRRS